MPPQLAGSNISFLELLNILVALKIWGKQFAGCKVRVYCDNMAAVHTLAHHKIVCPQLATVARNIWSLQVSLGVHLEVHHIAGKLNATADALSRFKSISQIQAFELANPGLQVTMASDTLCNLNVDI